MEYRYFLMLVIKLLKIIVIIILGGLDLDGSYLFVNLRLFNDIIKIFV